MVDLNETQRSRQGGGGDQTDKHTVTLASAILKPLGNPNTNTDKYMNTDRHKRFLMVQD